MIFGLTLSISIQQRVSIPSNEDLLFSSCLIGNLGINDEARCNLGLRCMTQVRTTYDQRGNIVNRVFSVVVFVIQRTLEESILTWKNKNEKRMRNE